jgi:hypothetical protein
LRVAAVQCGLPFDVAFSADDDFVLAWIIAKGENEGGTFSWRQMEWLKK